MDRRRPDISDRIGTLRAFSPPPAPLCWRGQSIPWLGLKTTKTTRPPNPNPAVAPASGLPGADGDSVVSQLGTHHSSADPQTASAAVGDRAQSASRETLGARILRLAEVAATLHLGRAALHEPRGDDPA